MSLSFTVKHTNSYKGHIENLVAITLDNSYPQNGWPITAANCKLRTLQALIVSGSAAGYPVHWDQANSKLKIFKAVGTEQDNGASTHNSVVIYAKAVGY
jgi:hypothetical protein